jgi:hypothetical protein
MEEFARSVNLRPDEAWEVYRQIKDLIVDSEVIVELTNFSATPLILRTSRYNIL